MGKIFDVSVIIVNWNAGKFLQETIESLYNKTKDLSFEIIIVDNNSIKTEESFLYIETLTEAENIKIIKSSENLGFAKANNLAMQNALGRNLLILNPDVVFHNKYN